MKICCGVILYNPTDRDIDNVVFYQNNFDKVYIYNNTEKDANKIKEEINKKENGNISIISSGTNNGLSIACQKLCEAAKKKGFDYIILYDQDSRMDEKSIHIFKNLKVKDDVVIYAPQIVYKGKEIIKKKNMEYINWCITSGSMINLNYFGNEFNFDANYFIDRVDKDFCEQIIRAGKKIVRVNEAILIQELGKMRMINGKPHYNHSTLRHYYMFRNRYYYNKKYKINKFITFMQVLSHLIRIILYETNKKEKLKIFIKARKDFKKNRMGKSKDYE